MSMRLSDPDSTKFMTTAHIELLRGRRLPRRRRPAPRSN
jgi:hypothetical protein